jgi:hypothetical protein
MEDPGSKHMAIGGLIFLAGCAVTLVTLAAADGGGRFVLAWGAILFGAIQFFYGVSQRGSSKRERNVPLADLSPDEATLLRAMTAASAVCGPLNDQRASMIRQLMKQITNRDVEATYIHNSARALAARGESVTGHLVDVGSRLTPHLREVIARACVAVMRGDGPLTEARREELLYIIRALRFRDEVLSQIEREMIPAPAAGTRG